MWSTTETSSRRELKEINMNKSRYLIGIGVIELIFTTIGLIYLFVQVVGVTAKASWSVFGMLNGFAVFLLWVTFFFCVLMGPSTGILFITVGKMCEYSPEGPTASDRTIKYHGSEITLLKEDIRKLNRRLSYLEEQERNVEESSKVQEEVPFEEKNDEVLNQEEKIETKKRDKFSYSLEEEIEFNDDYVINGVMIKKGTKGIIDNKLTTSHGILYVVIINGGKKTVSVSSDCFL